MAANKMYHKQQGQNYIYKPFFFFFKKKVQFKHFPFFYITNFLDNQTENYILLINRPYNSHGWGHSFISHTPTHQNSPILKVCFLLFSYSFSASKQKHYREFDHFGNLLEQTRGYAEKVLAGVTVNRNSELGEPPNAFELVVDRS